MKYPKAEDLEGLTHPCAWEVNTVPASEKLIPRLESGNPYKRVGVGRTYRSGEDLSWVTKSSLEPRISNEDAFTMQLKQLKIARFAPAQVSDVFQM